MRFKKYGLPLLVALCTAGLVSNCRKKEIQKKPVVTSTTKTTTIKPSLDELLNKTNTDINQYQGVKAGAALVYTVKQGDNIWEILKSIMSKFGSEKIVSIKTTITTYPDYPDSVVTKLDTTTYPIPTSIENSAILELMLQSRIVDSTTNKEYLPWEKRYLKPGDKVFIPLYLILEHYKREDIIHKLF